MVKNRLSFRDHSVILSADLCIRTNKNTDYEKNNVCFNRDHGCGFVM
jgi:hypothetical protein